MKDNKLQEERVRLFAGLYDLSSDGAADPPAIPPSMVRLLNPSSIEADDATSRRFALLEID